MNATIPDGHAAPIRVAVIGLGWAGQQHIAAYAMSPAADLIAIAGMEEELLQRLGSEYGVPTLLHDWREVLELPDVEAVSIATPPFLHAPIAKAALARGLHVLSEKPMARTGEEAEDMVQAARKAGRVLQVAFNHRFRGDMAHLKYLVDSGALGDVYYAKAYWLRRNGIPPLGWFTTKDSSGGGPLTDVGVHILDYSLHLMNDPIVSTVSASTYDHFGTERARASTHVPEPTFDVEDLATAFLRLDTGATLLVETSWVLHRDRADEFGVTLYGTRGGAELRVVDYAPIGSLRVFTEERGAPVESQVHCAPGPGHAGVVQGFLDAIRAGNWHDHDGSRAAQLSHLVGAAYQSAATRSETAPRRVPPPGLTPAS